MSMKGSVAWLLSNNSKGKIMYYAGVTTTPISDGSTVNPVMIGGKSVTIRSGGMVQYGDQEFFWSDEIGAWQESGRSDFGALAFKDAVLQANDTKETINSIEDVGELPSYTVEGTTVIFHKGTLPTKGSDKSVVTASGAVTVE